MINFKQKQSNRHDSIKVVFLLLAVCMLIVTISCKKKDKDEPVKDKYNEEEPLNKFYEKTGFTTTQNFINSSNYEFGLVFSPLVKGKIKALKMMLPTISNSVRVTIWDYDSKIVMRSEIMNVTSANTFIRKDIPEIFLEKDKKYLITMNSDDWYHRSKANKSNADYPITAGNIIFHEYRWLSGADQKFPTIVSMNYNAGDLDFVFQQID